MPSARIWRCARQKIAGAAAKRTLPPRVLQKGVALTGTTTVLLSQLTNIYKNATYLSDEEGDVSPTPSTIIGAENLWPRRFEYSYVTLAWLVIFSVKFSFLAFFRLLVGRVRTLFVYWRVIVVVNTLAFPYCILCTFVECRNQTTADSKLDPANLLTSS